MNFIFVVLLYMLFLIPKINIIAVGDFNAGLRFDDIIIALVAAILIFKKVASHEFGLIRYTREEKWFWLFFLICLIGASFNTAIFGRSSILFPIRFAEYFIFFYIGASLSNIKIKYVDKLILSVFWANCGVAALQLAGLVGGFTVHGYTANVAERVVGLTSGPWELGVVLNLVTCYVLASDFKRRMKVVVFIGSSFFILANGSRMSLVAQLAIILMATLFSGGIKRAVQGALVVVPILLIGFVLFSASTVASRSGNLLSIDNIKLLTDTIGNVHATESAPSWSDLGVLSRGDDIDASWSMRGPKWIYAAKMWALNPANVVWGVGSGTFGNALDGGWLRILTETGLLGIFFFIMMLKANYLRGGYLKLAVVAICVSMLFIDIYMAYKVMSIFFFMSGYAYSRPIRDQKFI